MFGLQDNHSLNHLKLQSQLKGLSFKNSFSKLVRPSNALVYIEEMLLESSLSTESILELLKEPLLTSLITF